MGDEEEKEKRETFLIFLSFSDFSGQAAKKKCKERELLKLAYWKINRPK
jgi:hypothetical protein